MWKWIKRYNLELYTVIMAVLAVILFVRWPVISYTRRILALFMILTTLHEWEETRYPGGFFELFLKRLGGDSLEIDLHLCHFIVAVILACFVLPGVLFPNLVWLAMMPVTLGILECVMHILGIFLFRMGKPYTPGLVTALLMLAGSIYALVTGFGAGTVRALDVVIGAVLMILGYLIMQQAMLRSAGLGFNEFHKMILHPDQGEK